MKPSFISCQKTLLVTASLVLLSACASSSSFKVGDVEDIGKASDLALACKTTEALAAADLAAQGGGLGGAMGGLMRIVILRDAGRTAEADAALADRNKRLNSSPKDAAEAETSITKTVEKIREERLKRDGRSTCP
jgi:hypothetical protein